MLRFWRARSSWTWLSSEGPSTPWFQDRLWLSPSRLSSPLAVVVLLVVGDQVVEGEPVVRGDEVDRGDGSAVVGLVEVGGAGEAGGELAEAGWLAAPEVAHGVAVLAVPFRPQGGEAADLVAALADVPGLGDQLDLGDDRVLVDQVEERREPVDLVELPGQGGGQVEPEPVDVHLGDPVAQRVHDQAQGLVVAHVEAVAGAGGVVVVAAGRRRRAGSRPGCRCRGTTGWGPGGCLRRCGCRPRPGSPRCRPGAGPGPWP